MSGEVRDAASRVIQRLTTIQEYIDELESLAVVIKTESSRYVEYKESNPDEYPYTHILDNMESDLEMAVDRMREAVRFVAGVDFYARRLMRVG